MKTVATSPTGELADRKHKDERQTGDVRTPFQHDKDRIIHSTAFRRLQYKTQVYAIHEGDLYRTRLTHSLEVAQIARGIAHHLGADPDLAEAISLAHDLGHAPFGHTGESKLRDLLAQFGLPFDHNVQSYRIVTDLEERYSGFRGLNLTHATLEGIVRHCTFFDREDDILAAVPCELSGEVSAYWGYRQPIIEAQIVNIADPIAYATHDLEDALEVGLLGWGEFVTLVEDRGIAFVGDIIQDDLREAADTYRQANEGIEEALVTKVRNRTLSRLLINRLILEAVEATTNNLEALQASGQPICGAVRQSSQPTVALQGHLQDQLRGLVQEILFDHVYREPRVMIMTQKADRILDTLFSSFMKAPGALPRRTQAKLAPYYQLTTDQRDSGAGRRLLARVVGDYISGMTDKYAMDTYQLLTQAYEKTL